GAFMAELGKRQGVGVLAFRFAVLTAGRTGEGLGARWAEIDLQGAVWTVPPGRMKAGIEHRVPLSDGALDVLREAARLRSTNAMDGPIFSGGKDTTLSELAIRGGLRRMQRSDIT